MKSLLLIQMFIEIALVFRHSPGWYYNDLLEGIDEGCTWLDGDQHESTQICSRFLGDEN